MKYFTFLNLVFRISELSDDNNSNLIGNNSDSKFLDKYEKYLTS